MEAGQTENEKKILVITHQLSRTGAPIVLLDLIRVCKKAGYRVEVISMLEGELRKELEELQIPIRIQERFFTPQDDFYVAAKEYDLVIANTLVCYEVIHCLKDTEIPVIWWLHEGKQYFEYFKDVLPNFRTLPANIHVYAVGHYVQDVIRDLYSVETEILHFGVEDVPNSNPKRTVVNKLQFLTVGTYSKVKAQDVLVEAIRGLPEEYAQKAVFLFCGNQEQYDEEVFDAVKKITKEFPNVIMLPQVSHARILDKMEQCDCLIVPSRIDPVPTVAVEMMMKKRACLCTEACGISYYIEDGVNGFVVPTDDAEQLRDKIMQLIDCPVLLEQVRAASRLIYDRYFAMSVFEPRAKSIVKKCMEGKCASIEKVLERLIKEEPEDVEQISTFLYQIGKTYEAAENYEAACTYFSRGLSYDLDLKAAYVIDMVVSYGYALLHCGRIEEALTFENIVEEFGANSEFQTLLDEIHKNRE